MGTIDNTLLSRNELSRFAHALRASMRARGWNVPDLAQRSGLARATLRRALTGTHAPTRRVLERLVVTLDDQSIDVFAHTAIGGDASPLQATQVDGLGRRVRVSLECVMDYPTFSALQRWLTAQGVELRPRSRTTVAGRL